MTYRSLVLVSLITMLIVGCSTTNIYDDVGAELVEEYWPTDSLYGHAGEWVKTEGKTRYLTDAEKGQAVQDSADCANELKESTADSPRTARRSVATFQLLECMSSKGWSFTLIPTIILQH